MNLGLQLAAFVWLWAQLSESWRIACLVIAIVDLLWLFSILPRPRLRRTD